MDKKWMVIGIISVIVLIIIGALAISTDVIFKGSSIDFQAENVDEPLVQEVEMPAVSDVVVEFSNMSELSEYLSENEIVDLEARLSDLFSSYLPKLAGIKSDYVNYYSQNNKELLTKIGSESSEEFTSFMHKLNRIQTYESCHIVLIPESLEVINSQYLMTVNVIYDAMSEIEYYIILDLKDLEIKIQ